jgi:site-specific DNA recombinase
MKLLPPRTAIYARVSTEQQVQHGTIQSQLAAVQEFAASHAMKIDPDLIFADNGVSGTTLARPRLDALRDKAAAGEIDQILILNPDRLARKYAHQLMLVEEFKKLSVEITFVNRQIAASPEDQLLLQIQGVISEYEREKIVERHFRVRARKDCRAPSARQTSQSATRQSLCAIGRAFRLRLYSSD